MEHLIAYEGVSVSLAVLQKGYRDEYLPWPNKRTDVNGTLQRPPYYPEDFDEWIDSLRQSKGKHEVFAVLVHEGDANCRTYRYIGQHGIHGITWPSGHATTGSIMGAADARGKGYGTEAKLLLQHHAFHVLGLRKLNSEVKEFNGQSLGHLIKCGYTIIGRRKKHDFHEGTWVDNIILECFREDWEPIWNAYQQDKRLPSLTDKQRKEVSKITRTKK